MKIQKTEEVYQAKYFSVERNTIERNGHIFIKDFIVRNPVVMIIPYTVDGYLYIESQYRDALQRTCLEVVAGNIEGNTDPLENAKRELREETGLTAKTWKLIATWELSPNMRSPQYIFAATGLTQGESALEIDEAIETIKLSFEDVEQKIDTGEIAIASHVGVLLFFLRLWKEGKL